MSEMTSTEVVELTSLGLGYLDEAGDATEEETEPPIDVEKPPTIDTKQRVLEDWTLSYPHTKRGPGDVVLSGPVIGGWGPGRYFRSKRTAFEFMVAKFGHARVRKLDKSTKGRWSLLIKDLRGEANAA